MDTNLTFATAVLGLFLSIPLFALARRQSANVWLALFVLGMAWLAAGDVFMSTRWYRQHPYWLAIFHWAIASIGPAFYCYARSLVGLSNGRKQVVHFVAPALLLALLLVGLVWVLVASQPANALRFLAHLLSVSLPIFQALSCAYALALLYRLRVDRARVLAHYSLAAGRDLRWLRWSTITILLLLIAWVPATELGGYWTLPLNLGRLAMFFVLGWYGMRQPSLFEKIPVTREARPEAPAAKPMPEQSDEPAAALMPETAETGKKYARSGMTDEAQRLIGTRLQRRMSEHRDFLEPDLRLTELAERIGAPPHLLSQYLNDVLGVSFFDYVNGQRAQEVQRLMLAPASAGTLLDLAYAAGFNSKSAFNTAFKKATGMAPSAWRQLNVATSAPIG